MNIDDILNSPNCPICNNTIIQVDPADFIYCYHQYPPPTLLTAINRANFIRIDRYSNSILINYNHYQISIRTSQITFIPFLPTKDDPYNYKVISLPINILNNYKDLPSFIEALPKLMLFI